MFLLSKFPKREVRGPIKTLGTTKRIIGKSDLRRKSKTKRSISGFLSHFLSVINPTAPDEALPQRINDLKENAGNLLVPPCLSEALRRGIIFTPERSSYRFSFLEWGPPVLVRFNRAKMRISMG